MINNLAPGGDKSRGCLPQVVCAAPAPGQAGRITQRRGMITKRVRDLPKEFYIPNNCEQCGKYMGVEPASKFTWVTDGTTEGTKGFCGIRCAKKYEQRTATGK